MKLTQKLRVVVNGVCFNSTVKKVRYGVGDQYATNAATQKCLLVLENMRKTERFAPVGLAGVWEGMNVQIDMVE